MNQAIMVRQTGGPEVLAAETIDVPVCGAGEVLVRNAGIGVNFLDVYMRTGRYPAKLPFVPGHEGAGVVEAVGPDVAGFAVGDAVGYVDPMGAYATLVKRPAARLVKLPDGIDPVAAAAMMLKGMTAEYLLRRTYAVQPGDWILVHAAAGGVGQILCQWAAHIGANVIGTVGSEAKRGVAEQLGCRNVLVTGGEGDWVAEVRSLTGGRGVAVAYDGVGAATFAGSLRSVRVRGLVAAFGAASGPIPPLDVQSLAGLGSLYVTRPGLAQYTATTEELQDSARALFDVVATGAVRIAPPRTLKLSEAAQAHRDLEARATTGSTVLIPG